MQKNLSKRYKLFLFDLDGTLLDTAREFHLALNEVLKKENKPSQNFENVRERVSDGAGALVTLGFNIDEQSIYFEEKRNSLGWDKKAKILVCPDDVENLRKPDPASLKYALRELKQLPKDTIYVGDNWRDIEAARNANITPVFAEYGYIKNKKFPLNKNGFNIRNIKEILAFT